MDVKFEPNKIALQADNTIDFFNPSQIRTIKIGNAELIEQQSLDWLYQTPEKTDCNLTTGY